MDGRIQNIDRAEKKWKDRIIRYIEDLFNKSPLPSHNLSHHLRVWNHAKTLLKHINSSGTEVPYDIVEELIISCLFHDTGLTRSKSSDHGLESRKICEEFLSTTEMIPENTTNILVSIEKHDDKQYSGSGNLVEQNHINPLTVLSIADDLDALGNIGIYRYIEIYLMRGIPFEDLGFKILANLSGRYKHFLSNCSQFDKLVSDVKSKYDKIERFFLHYNHQIHKNDECDQVQNSGHIAVAKQIYRHTLLETREIMDVCKNVLSSEHDLFVISYFQELSGDLKKMNA